MENTSNKNGDDHRIRITNCHIHTFTIDHVPSGFLPFGLVRILKPKLIRKIMGWTLRRIFPFTDRDLLDRHINFMEITANRNQLETFNRIRGYYPKETRFIILPMDMHFMGAGKLGVGIEQQLQELNKIYKEFPESVVPFIPVDPRRPNVLELVKRYVEEHQFKGIKLYPRLGFYPNDKRLYPIYEYAQANNLPVLSHCSRGGVYTREVTQDMLFHPSGKKLAAQKPRDFSHHFSEPLNYKTILEDFPDLRICLAHFGGNEEWDKYLEHEWDPLNPELENRAWVKQIVELMKQYSNLYTDVSYTAFHSNRYFPLMSLFIDDPRISDRILFGSDYFMVEREKVSEREMSIQVRYALGEERYRKISQINPISFIGY